jgi:methenyltetrahydromethanopterin cyclohydrolase
MSQASSISLNARAAALVDCLIADAAELGIGVDRGPSGETLIDAGSQSPGSIAAGLRIAEICTGGLAQIDLLVSRGMAKWPWTITVRSSLPVLACLAGQYAGWRLMHGEGRDSFFALGSGPARALAHRETLFDELDYTDHAERAVLVIESDKPPPPAVVVEVASACGMSADRLIVIYAPTQSRAGGVQVVARVLEVALHKAHELGYPLDRIVEGLGAAPPAPSRLHQRDGPHQRRHYLRRRGPPIREGAVSGGESSCRAHA